jgi:hypothetical protein
MQLAPIYIEYLKAVLNGEMEDLDRLQDWWGEHHHDLRDSVPIWMLMRFQYGWTLCAEVTLQAHAEQAKACPAPTDEPNQTLFQLRQGENSALFRQFAVACCRRRLSLLSTVWKEGLQVAEDYAEGRGSQQAWELARETLTADFREVHESDAGEIYAAKEAVLALFDPDPYCSAIVVSSAVLTSAFAETDDIVAEEREATWQTEMLQAKLA